MPQTLFVGNKEAYRENEPTPAQQPPAGSPYEAAQKHRRFQIYVHSKMLIVDDEVKLMHNHFNTFVNLDMHRKLPTSLQDQS